MLIKRVDPKRDDQRGADASEILARAKIAGPQLFLALAALLLGTRLVVGEDKPSPPEAYVLGPNDQVGVLVPDAEDLNGKVFRVGTDGFLELPTIGRVLANGLTTQELEKQIDEKLRRFLEHPDVVLTVTEFRSQPVSVLGAVNSPGVHQLQGTKTLCEVLSAAGGLRPDSGSTVTVTRKMTWRPIPLTNAKADASGQFSIATINIKSILDGRTPEDNITIKPEDVISVPKEDLIYVIGSVRRAGGFALGENSSLSALQALSLAEGLEPVAAANKAKVIRYTPGDARPSEIPVNLRKLLAGKSNDVRLKANDILFIPSSLGKTAAMHSLETIIGMGGQIGAGMAIYK